MKYLLVNTDNKYKIVGDDNLNELVDGNIELVKPKYGYTDKLLLNGNVFVCDDEFIFKDKPHNHFGSLLYNGTYSIGPIYPIRGNIVITGEELASLKDDEITYYIQILKLLKYKEMN